MVNDQPLIANKAKQRLKEGEPIFVFQVWEFMRPSIVKIAAQAGFHMLWVENEHVLRNEEALTDFIVAARDNGLDVLTSVPTHERHYVSRVLDAGAVGIMLPHAETVEQIQELVRWVKYPPSGERAVVFGPNADYREPSDLGRFCEESNEATMILLKIESRKGVENAEALLSNEWVDAMCFGPVDLSVSMGFPGQTDHPEQVAAMEGVVDLALSKDVAVAFGARDRATYERQRKRGIRIFSPGGELDLLRESALNFMEMVR